MPLKDIFKSKDRESSSNCPPPALPEFTFIRSDTNTQTIIHPPTGFPEGPDKLSLPKSRPRSGSASSFFRENFSFGHHRSRSSGLINQPPSSTNVPKDLPSVAVSNGSEEHEAQWEKRATVLVGGAATKDLTTPVQSSRSRSGSVASHVDDENIQEAIRLHESGDLQRSTRMFGRLADPKGANNPLSQVLYGLALRHGWGIEKDLPRAMQYLETAAKNSAAVENEALQAGMKRGGTAKGELVLAIYELGNSYRQGWGVNKDPVAAREYYETAANLGDSDAQNEVGWCYLEGFGCKKDKMKAAKFYRMAEKQGNKTLGNSW
ncbi:hypothetical protein EDC01DRAFT_614225 [Geopyxis carbonaria]|nr:hypothetical protein EDC01DRAFT_614225 [Geopyxis carbonaria]